jgi:hypothetical protein
MEITMLCVCVKDSHFHEIWYECYATRDNLLISYNQY